jgi:hypothetical protein
MVCMLLCSRGPLNKIDGAWKARVALKAEKKATHNQRMAKQDADKGAKAAAKELKHAEFMESLSKGTMQESARALRRGRDKEPHVPRQLVDQVYPPESTACCAGASHFSAALQASSMASQSL